MIYLILFKNARHCEVRSNLKRKFVLDCFAEKARNDEQNNNSILTYITSIKKKSKQKCLDFF